MIKQFSSLQLFSLVDGRLSTNIDDVYDMLDHICDEPGLMTHHLPVAMKYLKEKNPKWFQEYKARLDILKTEYGNDFSVLIHAIEGNVMPLHSNLSPFRKVIDVPQLKDEFDTSDFGDFMASNSLLLNKK